MFNVSLYLEKFKTLGVGDIAAKDSMIGAVLECVGVELQRKDIEYKNGTFRIKADPIIKSQIYVKKTSILEHVSKKLEGEIKDVR
jgi:hypothetical protein